MKKTLALLLIIILIIGAIPALTFALGTSGGGPADESILVQAAGAVLFSPSAEGARGTESSEKEITAVRLLDGSKSLIAEGVADGDAWTITLPPDTDQDLIGRIGASADVFMQIEYNGVSLKQEGGYDDTGQDSWASGNILCGVSVNSQKTFTVKAADGSTKDFTIAIVYDESQDDEPVPGQYHIGVSTPPGGTLTPNATTANEGDNIIVTVTPNEGYRMVDGTLSYTLNVAGGETVKITGNRFTMPDCDVTLTCRWEEASGGPSLSQQLWDKVREESDVVDHQTSNVGWINLDGTWYYAQGSGAFATGWLKDGSTWYYLNPETYAMMKGWVKVNNTWYYLKESGAMATGWVKDGDTWYYMNSSGAMAANEWCGGYWLGASGAWTYQPIGSWKKNNTGWWFGDTSGWYAKSTTQKIDGVNYTFNAAGYWVQ